MSLPADPALKLDVQQLEADAYVWLFEIQLYPTGSLFLARDYTVFWQGNNYEFWGLQLTGESRNSDDQAARPQLSLANFTYDVDGEPIKGVFSALNAQNKIEGATVIRRKVLKNHVTSNTNIKIENRWKVSRIIALTPDVVSLELRNTLDGPRFQLPARKFIPPDFPQVSLS